MDYITLLLPKGSMKYQGTTLLLPKGPLNDQGTNQLLYLADKKRIMELLNYYLKDH